MSFAYLVLSFFVWAFPLIFLKKKLYFIIGFFFLLLSPLEIIFVRSLGTPLTVGFIDSVLKSNFKETTEQLSGNIMLLGIFVLVIVLYLYFLFKIENQYLSKKIRKITLGLFVIFNLGLLYQMFSIQKDFKDTFDTKVEQMFSTTFMKYEKIYPSNLIFNTYSNLLNYKKINEMNARLSTFTFQAKSQNPKDDEEVFVLVIGETARFGNFHLNGYSRQTSPYLDKIPNLLSFQNVYAQANLTSISVPQIITRATPENQDLQYSEKNIADAFYEAGFYTAWLANQSGENPMIKRMSKSIDYFKSNNTEVDTKSFLDEDILPQFNDLLANNKNKKFIAIHSLGSHFRYTSRYQKSFEKFKPTMNETGYNTIDFSHKQEIINSYDNSILYTDYFLHLLIDDLKKTNKKAVLIYVADHGENLYDDDKKYFAHGTVAPTKYEYHIPYFIWYSDEYKEANPKKINELSKNLTSAANSGTTFYTLLDLANIHYKNSNNELFKSLSSEKYIAPKERKMLNSERKIIKIK